jgi:hypothetical protein
VTLTWHYRAYVGDEAAAAAEEPIADRWHFGFYVLFVIAILCFLGASVALGVALLHTGPSPTSGQADIWLAVL